LDFSEHLVISAAGSAAILAGGGDPASAAAFFGVGVFMDLDHVADYWRETGLNADIPRFMGYFSSRSAKKLWLFLHAWEWQLLALGLWLVLAPPWPWMAWGLAGWICHLLLDQRFNHLHPLAYFMAFRFKHGFLAERFYAD
jgi:hypothetical protein